MTTKNVLAMISPMSSERVNGIARYAKEHGWNLMIQDRLGYTPVAWQGDGILATLRSDPVTYRSVASLMRRGIPVVDLTISRPDVEVPRVTSDHAAIGRLAASHFLEREFKNLAWFSTAWGNVHRLRYEGFCEVTGHSVPRWVVEENEWRTFAAHVGHLLASAAKPLAVLTYDETDAARLLYAAGELGISIPEELAILSVGNNRLICENQSIPLSSIDQNLELGGYEAAKLLDDLMSNFRHRSSASTLQLISPAGIVTRRSTDVIAVNDPILRGVLAYISNHLTEPIGAPQISQALNLKRYSLDLLFRNTLNRSIGEEIRRQRLAKAKLLLRETSKTIAEIAAETGHCTPSHLSNAFVSAFNLTPRAWRKAHQ